MHSMETERPQMSNFVKIRPIIAELYTDRNS